MMNNVVYEAPFERFVSNMVVEMSGIDALNIGEVIAAIDLGAGDRCAMLVGMAGVGDRFHVLYEYFGEDGGLVELLDRQDALDALSPAKVLVGNDAGSRSVIDGVSPAALLEERGFEVDMVGGSLRRGMARVRSLVTSDPGLCDLTISPRCSRLIEDLRRCKLKPAQGDGLEWVDKGPSHSVDALRYFVSNQIMTVWQPV